MAVTLPAHLSEMIGDRCEVAVVDVGANPIDGPPPYAPLVANGQARVVGRREVQTVRLDDVPETDGVAFLKLDIQGAELLALSHATARLRRALVVHTEVEFLQMYKGQPLFAEVDQFLRTHGFVLHTFHPLVSRMVTPLVVRNTSRWLPRAGRECPMPTDCIVIENATAILPERLLPAARVVLRAGRIAAVGRAGTRVPRDAQAIDARGGFVSPGFIDVHVHGGGGADFMDGTPDAVRTVCATHARHGTTTIFPTTTTGSPEEIHAMIDACRMVRDEAAPVTGARIAGIHLYGPFFAPDKVGCHSADGRRDPTPAEFSRYFATRLVRIATCAAELPGAAAFFRKAQREGCFITCGHSNASWTEMDRAYRAGMRHVDHFWCAMSSVPSMRARLGTPMQGSMEQYVLANDGMSTEVIADGHHLSPELLQFAYRMLGSRRLLLVTDASRAVDLAPGRYTFGHAITGTDFDHDGAVGRAPGGGLASAAVGMDHMVRTMQAATKAPLCDVVRMASLTPAERLGMAHEVGSLTVGTRADVLVLGPRLSVRQVFIGGVPLRGARRRQPDARRAP